MKSFKTHINEAYFKIADGKAKKTAETEKTLKTKGVKIPKEQILKIADNSDIDTIWCRFDYSLGNQKVGDDTIIFNMGSAADCPSAAAGLCDLYNNKLCYAENSESRFPATLASRRRQSMQWKNMTPEQIGMALEAIIAGKKKKNIRYVRINESGDFWNQEDVEKLGAVADYLAQSPVANNVTLYTYTHRRDLDFGSLMSNNNVVIQGSGMLDNGEPFMLDNNFMAYDYADMIAMMEKDPNSPLPENFTQCPGDCSVCSRCKLSRRKIIGIIMHGGKSNLKKEQSYITRVIQDMIKKNGNDTLPDEYIKRLFVSQHNNEIDMLDKLSQYVIDDRITQKQLDNIFLRRREVDHFMKGTGTANTSWKALITAPVPVLKENGISDAVIKKAQKFSPELQSQIAGDPEQFNIGPAMAQRYPLQDLGGNVRESIGRCAYQFPIEEGKGKSYTPPLTKLATDALVGNLKQDPRHVAPQEFTAVLMKMKEDATIFLSSIFMHGKKMVSKFNSFTKSLFS